MPNYSEDDALEAWLNAAKDHPDWTEGWNRAAYVAIARATNDQQVAQEPQIKQPIKIDWLQLNADMSKV
jgi:hypothetical protein